MRVDISAPVKLAARDTVLLASDGLVDNLFFDEIIATVRAGPLTQAIDKLVQSARRRMVNDGSSKPSKPDDLTVMVCRADGRRS
jgi:serine/threonine protein phosphatase PrpC